MARPSRFSIAKADILEFFGLQNKHIYNRQELASVLVEQRAFWRLAKSMRVDDFISELIKKTPFKKVEFSFNSSTTTRYLFKDTSPYALALSLKPKSYLSHYTALSLHRLTNQQPKTIYISHELSSQIDDGFILEQENIDKAFSKPQRKSNLIAKYEEFNICILSAKYTDQQGIISINQENGERIKITNLERTLIDCVVRPAYSGGIREILNAFQNAKNRISINKLNAILRALNYKYPYRQAIGFYLERAGYNSTQLALLKQDSFQYNFYLMYDMKDPSYSESWKLFYPKGF